MCFGSDCSVFCDCGVFSDTTVQNPEGEEGLGDAAEGDEHAG